MRRNPSCWSRSSTRSRKQPCRVGPGRRKPKPSSQADPPNQNQTDRPGRGPDQEQAERRERGNHRAARATFSSAGDLRPQRHGGGEAALHCGGGRQRLLLPLHALPHPQHPPAHGMQAAPRFRGPPASPPSRSIPPDLRSFEPDSILHFSCRSAAGCSMSSGTTAAAKWPPPPPPGCRGTRSPKPPPPQALVSSNSSSTSAAPPSSCPEISSSTSSAMPSPSTSTSPPTSAPISCLLAGAPAALLYSLFVLPLPYAPLPSVTAI